MSKDDARIRVVVDDITRLDVDAVVTAANSRLAGGGGVDGAIHRAAGPQLLAACRELGGCPTGEARITPGFDLPARWVIHAVGPVWHGGERDEDALLAGAYRSSLALAREQECREIAFPAISCGVYGFPPERAARHSVETLREELADTAESSVILCAFDDAMAGHWRAALDT